LHIFKQQQQEYKEEGINLEQINFVDNKGSSVCLSVRLCVCASVAWRVMGEKAILILLLLCVCCRVFGVVGQTRRWYLCDAG
jgi:hypothetical protein